MLDPTSVLPPGITSGEPAAIAAVFKPDEVTELLREVTSRRPGSKTGLDRDTARTVLAMLEDLQRNPRRMPKYVFCPYCRQGFDSAHSHVHPGGPDRPPRHPDPIRASETSRGAETAAAALATAVRVNDPRLVDSHDFWMAHGRMVLWPLLYVARATDRTMDDVRAWTDPAQLGEALVTVGAALEAIEGTTDAERVRRQWRAVANLDVRPRRAAFDKAHGQVWYWQATGRDAILGRARPADASRAGTSGDGQDVGTGVRGAS